MNDCLHRRAEIRITGAEPWRFLDRCARAGIRLEAVRAEDALNCIALVRTEDLPSAERLAERSGCGITILRVRGTAALARRLGRRRTFLAAVSILAALLCVSGLFVWDVRVVMNDSDIPDGVLVRVLAEQGVGVGSFWPAFRGERIRTRALLALPQLSFLSVNVRAGRAEVTARAAVPAPEIRDSSRAGGVTAAKSGVIASITVLAGEARVRRGDAVNPGQVLIAGTAADPCGRGEVRAYTYREIIAAAPLTRWEKTYTGPIRRRFALIAGSRRINFYPGSGILPPEYDKMTKETTLALKNVLSLPLKWVTETGRPYSLKQVPEDREALRTRLETELLRELSEELGDRGEVLRTFFTASERDGVMTLTLRAECLERIDQDTAGDQDS